jgi:multidrug efflux system membrane fusion protein
MISEETETRQDEAQAPPAPAPPPDRVRHDVTPPSFQLPEAAARTRRRRWPWVLAAVAVAALVLYLVLPHGGGAKGSAAGADAGAKGGAGGAAGAQRAVPVLAAPSRRGDVGVYLTGLGNVTALNSAVVKSRVDGQLLRIDFREGQTVRQGQLLAELDPRPFQVQLMQAEGQKAKDEATLQNARVDLQRYQVLMQEDSVPRQQLDSQAATVKQLEATIQSDQAQVESAKLNLTYSRITAPIGGRVGLRLVDTGNIVHASDPNGIVMVNQVQPITTLFTIPSDRLPAVLQQLHAGRQLPVEAYDREMKIKLADGSLAAVDNQIDPTTGTVRLRAVFTNESDALFPSQFVNARLLVDTLRGVVVVPSAAIQRSPNSAYVYVVRPDQAVALRNVDVQLTEGDDTVVRSGVAPGELVVVDGLDRLREGMKVSVTLPGAKPAAGGGGQPGAHGHGGKRGAPGAAPTAPGAAGAPAAARSGGSPR